LKQNNKSGSRNRRAGGYSMLYLIYYYSAKAGIHREFYHRLKPVGIQGSWKINNGCLFLKYGFFILNCGLVC